MKKAIFLLGLVGVMLSFIVKDSSLNIENQKNVKSSHISKVQSEEVVSKKTEKEADKFMNSLESKAKAMKDYLLEKYGDEYNEILEEFNIMGIFEDGLSQIEKDIKTILEPLQLNDELPQK